MGSLIRFAAALCLMVAEPCDAGTTERWSDYIAEASRRFGVPQVWIRRVIEAESGGRTVWRGRPTTSRAGAIGLMQLMPATWAEMRSVLGLGSDPHDPRDNILAGTAYLRAMYDRFGYPGLFAAYNAGPARYARSLESGAPLPRETRTYVARVSSMPLASSWWVAGRAAAFHKPALFVVPNNANAVAAGKSASSRAGKLFAIPPASR